MRKFVLIPEGLKNAANLLPNEFSVAVNHQHNCERNGISERVILHLVGFEETVAGQEAVDEEGSELQTSTSTGDGVVGEQATLEAGAKEFSLED